MIILLEIKHAEFLYAVRRSHQHFIYWLEIGHNWIGDSWASSLELHYYAEQNLSYSTYIDSIDLEWIYLEFLEFRDR